MYIADQAPFFNGVIEIETKLSPSALLLRLIEWWSKIRYGPRSVDLYIIYYGIGTENETEKEMKPEIKLEFALTLTLGRKCHQLLVGNVTNLPTCKYSTSPRVFVPSPLSDLNKHDVVLHPSIYQLKKFWPT
jgi:hypothetical protein